MSDDMEQQFRDYLDEVYDSYQMGELTFTPSDILENCDPVAFRVYFSDWDSEHESDDDDSDDDDSDDDDSDDDESCNVLFCIGGKHEGDMHYDVTGRSWHEVTPDSPVIAHVYRVEDDSE